MKAKTPFIQDIFDLLAQEEERHNTTINLIASENYPSAAVRDPLRSIASTKYAEGYPGARYYAGCSIVDEIERRAQQAALDLFVPTHMHEQYHVNVQPHAGSMANLAAYQALLQPGDIILSMKLSEGGHLTHGHPINLSGKLYQIVSYGVNHETGFICYDTLAELARTHHPKLIIAGASAYSRTLDFARFRAIADSVNALLLVDMAHIAGLVAGGCHPSPIGYADVITSTTHKTLRGSRGAFIICSKEYAKRIDAAVMPGLQGGPFMHAIASHAIAFRQAATPAFATYAQAVCSTAHALAAALKERGYHIVSGGTDTHLFLIDFSKTPGLEHLTGQEAEGLLADHGIITNRNTVPGDTRPPRITSGIRIGLAAMVTRGMQPEDAPSLAADIDAVLQRRGNPFLA